MMGRFSWTSERIRQVLGLPPAPETSRPFTGVSTDSRRLRSGELFVALRGERFDGTDFVAAAAAAGAGGAVVERRPDGVADDFELFLVDDALRALGRLAAARRSALDPIVVAITGTSGKTTTRALMTAAIGDEAYGSPGNFNNLIGLPLSILAAPEDCRIWVLEVASNQRGEIERLGHIARPDYAVITSVSEGHLDGLGDLEGVLDEKLSLLASLSEGGLAFIADEPTELVARACKVLPGVRTVGLGPQADERPQSWSVAADGMVWKWGGVEFSLPGFGTHLIRDALFALAVARQLGVEPGTAAERLRDAQIPPMRGEVRRVGDLVLLIDCYNANPSSFQAAIEALAALAGGRRRAALAGTMLELGARSDALHEQVAGWLLEAGIELIAATGEFAAAFLRSKGVSHEGLIVEERLEDGYRELSSRLTGDEVVLLKASRGMRFERSIPWFERDFGSEGRMTGSGTGG